MVVVVVVASIIPIIGDEVGISSDEKRGIILFLIELKLYLSSSSAYFDPFPLSFSFDFIFYFYIFHLTLIGLCLVDDIGVYIFGDGSRTRGDDDYDDDDHSVLHVCVRLCSLFFRFVNGFPSIRFSFVIRMNVYKN